MNQRIAIPVLLLSCLFLLPAADLEKAAGRLTRAEMQSAIEFLSHDLLQGRAPGTRGGELAEIYIQSAFKWLGLEPGAGGQYLQPFILKGFQTREMELSSGALRFKFPDDLVAVHARAEENFDLEGDAVFVGFGIRTGIWDWDDFKDANLKGKILVCRVNDPGMFLPGIFEGATLTYFGRWRYKIEEAARTGASGILLIHTDASAGYSWQVVQNSWNKENLFLESDLRNDLKLHGWIREESFRKILAQKKIDLDVLYRKSLSRKFRPVPLGLRLRASGQSRFRTLTASNVVARIPGRSDREIVLSSHIDGHGANPKLEGDTIFNGAIDNCSATAAMLLAAKLLQEQRQERFYTLTFLACQAEEEGMLGSQYYVENADRTKIVADINFESTPVWEASRDVMAVGARYSTLEGMIREIASAQGWKTSEFSLANQGFFYRSDQFPFARRNIPSVWLSAGEGFASGKNHLAEFFVGGNYHTVKDEYDPAWPLESLRQTVKLAVLLIAKLDETRIAPQWKGRLTFPTERD